MADGWLIQVMQGRAGLETIATVVVVAALLILPGAPPQAVTTPSSIAYAEAGSNGALPPGGSAWHRMGVEAVAQAPATGWLVWDDIAIEQDGTPMEVRMSGPFSAAVFFNGVEIGDKGVPGATRGEERAGPIDARIALPAALMQPTGNRLALHLSSHRAGYVPHTLIQSLAIEPYSADARRSLRYYMPLNLLGSALLALMIAIMLRSRAVGDRRGFWLMAAIAGLLLALLGEVSRALINYSYEWHQPRQAVILAGLSVFGGALLRYSQCRWSGPSGAKRTWLVVSALAVTTAIVAMTGYDGKSIVASAVLLMSTATWMIWYGDSNARWLAGGLLVMVAFAGWQSGDYLDRSVYALALALLALPAIRHPGLWLPERPSAASPSRLRLQATGRLTVLETSDVTFLKACGNYTEVHTQTGGQHLDNRNLRAVLESIPGRFFRLHRSHAVNLEHGLAIVATAGSRYRLQLKTGGEIPVSRDKVSELRTRLLSN